MDKKNKIIAVLEQAYVSRINNLKLSVELADKALAESREIGDRTLIGKSLNHLALFYMIMGDYDRSMKLSEEAIIRFEELKDKKGIADAKYNIAGIYYKTDNYHLGLVYLMDCLSIYKKYKDFHNQARVQKSLGTIYEYYGDQNNAIQAYESSIENAIKVSDLNLESNAYNPLSGIYLKQNNIEKADEIIELSVNMKKLTGDLRGLAFSIYGRGKVNKSKGLFKEAEMDFLEALTIHKEMGEHLGEAMTYNKMGALYFENGFLDKAKNVLQKGLETSEQFNILITKFKCSYLLYLIYKKENNLFESLKYLEIYLVLKETVINTQTLRVIENYELISKMKWLEKKSEIERKKSEEQIKLSNERYELATKATKDIIWDWDIVNNKIYRSVNYGLIFGYKPTENNIYLESWIKNLHPNDRSRIVENLNNKIKDPNCNLWEDEYRYYRADGELAHVMDRGYIIRDTNRSPIRMVGAMMDISLQKDSEKEREKMTNDIIQRNKDLEQFAYIVSHNLRSPVANIIGFLELLKDKNNNKEEISEFIDIISDSANSLDSIVSDLNNILQIKSEIIETKRNIVFTELINDIKLSILNVIKEENVTIITDFMEVDEMLSLRSYFYSIFYNLITNSIKYRRPDISPIIIIKSFKKEDTIGFSISDNGIGIDLKKNGNDIFGLYKRFHRTVEGKGIGLYMTKTQVETLGGSISIASELNSGTEFIIQFDN